MLKETPVKLIKISQLLAKLQISKTFFYGQIVKMPDFPEQVYLPGCCIRFVESDVDEWIRIRQLSEKARSKSISTAEMEVKNS